MGAPYLLCVQVALWLAVVVLPRPAGRMETMKEAVVGRGCVLGCPLQTGVFCAGSCASGGAPERRCHQHGTGRLRRRLTCVVCMVGAEAVQKNHLLAVCWMMEPASLSLGGRGLCWVSVGGASPCYDWRMRKVLSDLG